MAKKRLLQVDELEEFHLGAYENARLYKEIRENLAWSTYSSHGAPHRPFSSIVQHSSSTFPIKLQSQWTSPYNVIQVFPYGSVEIQRGMNGKKVKVNGHQLKTYYIAHFHPQPFTIVFESD